MAESARKAFLGSPHHATLSIACLGAALFGGALGLGDALPAIAGGVAYVLGWVYLPDMPLFTRWRERKAAASLENERRAELGEFAAQRDALLSQLTTGRRRRHEEFTATCAAIAIGHDPRARKLEEMQWTFLRLLGIEQSLEAFLEGERRDGVPVLLAEAEDELAALEKEIEKARHHGEIISTAREKLLESRRSRHEVLKQRSLRITEAQDNARLASAELERLEDQVKLIRADTVASRHAGSMSERIDATFTHLAETNRWLAEMDQFRDQLGHIPEGGMGVRNPFAIPVAQPPAARPQKKQRAEDHT